MAQQLLLDILAPSPQTLENFAGDQNGALLHALQHQSRPGRAVYIWGPSGAGRTHLLRAASRAADGAYFDPAQDAARLRELAGADAVPWPLVAIDDVNQLDDAGQAALFGLYNRWREAGTGPGGFVLVTAGDHAPRAMSVREDLRTRLGWDLTFRLHQLSDDERSQALQAQAHERGLTLTPEVMAWLLVHYTRDMRHLSSLIDALDRYSLERHRPITVPLLKDLLARSGSAPV